MMALAETYSALGHADAAIQIWERVLANNSYSRAHAQLREVIETDAHAPAFDRKRNRIWLKRARSLWRQT